MKKTFVAELHQDDRGMWHTNCPFCDWNATGFLHGFCMNKLRDHLNEEHTYEAIGNA